LANAFKAEYERKFHRRLQEDFPFYARWCLKIKNKEGNIVPFILNRVQEHINKIVEKQLVETGKVRIILLKARQEGASTYIGGRFYHHTTLLPGKATFILSHESSTTDKLFSMVSRMHQNCPDAIKLIPDIANQRRLAFSTGSEYFVGTAGNEDVGRGGTVQYLHASEVAYYQNAIGFKTGLLQSVPDSPGTEVFLESTANGMDSVLYPMSMDALQGKGDYILIFTPWFWQTEYRRKAPVDFIPTPEELEIQKTYSLDNDQLYWRRIKVIELGNITDFMREYPSSIEEAFITSGDALILPMSVAKARKSGIVDNQSALIIGADPNEAGGPIGIVWRRGRQILKKELFENKKPMEVVSHLANIIKEDNPVKMFLDNGNGYGIIDRLIELGYEKTVLGVDFGGAADEEKLYINKRVEMAVQGAQWFTNGGVGMPDDDLFQKHLCCVPAKKKTSGERWKLEAKETIIKNTGIDPHLFDAFILTFAYPVRTETWNQAGNKIKKVTKTASCLKSVRRRGEFQKGEGESNVATATLSL
jgi:hypothetical protein